MITLLVFFVALACIFEFVNGFHDTANAVATVIYTKSLKPTHAVVWSGFWTPAEIVASLNTQLTALAWTGGITPPVFSYDTTTQVYTLTPDTNSDPADRCDCKCVPDHRLP